MVTDHDIAFVVPDSCRVDVKNSNSINTDVIENTIENN
jgi:hypothetical protein